MLELCHPVPLLQPVMTQTVSMTLIRLCWVTFRIIHYRNLHSFSQTNTWTGYSCSFSSLRGCQWAHFIFNPPENDLFLCPCHPWYWVSFAGMMSESLCRVGERNFKRISSPSGVRESVKMGAPEVESKDSTCCQKQKQSFPTSAIRKKRSPQSTCRFGRISFQPCASFCPSIHSQHCQSLDHFP